MAFTFTTTRRDWKRLRKLTKRIDCDMTAVSWKGTPFFLGRMRRRVALWGSLAAGVLLLFYSSLFIWDFEIEGNKTVSDQAILRALEKQGVGFGTYSYAVNSAVLRNNILLEMPELSYIAVNVRGCRAYVQVRERVLAAKDALVTAIQPWDGEKQVLPGTTVREGQLLISGVVQNDFGGVRYLRGMGKVYGRTWYTLQCRVPLTKQVKTYTGDEKVRRAVLIGKKRINFYFSSSIPGDTYDKIVSQDKWTLPGDVALPVTMVTERLRPYTLTERERAQEEAVILAEKVLSARLEDAMEEGEVLERDVTWQTEGDTLLVTLSAECLEQIGRFVDAPE